MYGVYLDVTSTCADPKGYEPALDSAVDGPTKKKVEAAAKSAYYDSCVPAINAEIAGDHKKAIGHWQTVFGPSFPSYS
jgi:hypothetical protein